MIHIDPGERHLIPGEEVPNPERVAGGAGSEHAKTLKVRRHEQLAPRNKRPQQQLAERRPLAMMRLRLSGAISKTSVSPRAIALTSAGLPVTRLTSPPNS